MTGNLPDPSGAAPVDWRGLCERFVSLVERCPVTSDTDWIAERNELIVQVHGARRAALAQPEPEVVGPSDEEAQQLFDDIRVPIYGRLTTDTSDRVVGHEPVRPGDFARAVLSRYGRPAPAPAGEVGELVGLFRGWADAYPDGVKLDPQWLTRAADLLEMCFSAKIAHDGSGNNE